MGGLVVGERRCVWELVLDMRGSCPGRGEVRCEELFEPTGAMIWMEELTQSFLTGFGCGEFARWDSSRVKLRLESRRGSILEDFFCSFMEHDL